MAYGDLHASDPTLGAYGHGYDVNPGMELPFYDPGLAGPMYGAAIYENPQVYEAMPTHAAPAYEATPEVQQPTLVSAPLEATPARPRALTIRPMPPPIQSGVTASTTTDRLNSVLNEGSILLIVDGLPKDFGVGVGAFAIGSRLIGILTRLPFISFWTLCLPHILFMTFGFTVRAYLAPFVALLGEFSHCEGDTLLIFRHPMRR